MVSTPTGSRGLTRNASPRADASPTVEAATSLVGFLSSAGDFISNVAALGHRSPRGPLKAEAEQINEMATQEQPYEPGRTIGSPAPGGSPSGSPRWQRRGAEHVGYRLRRPTQTFLIEVEEADPSGHRAADLRAVSGSLPGYVPLAKGLR